jgi:hypothetical protein
MRIDQVSGPRIHGKKPEEAVKILAGFCHETAIRVMQLNNQIEDLKDQVAQLRARHP